MKTVRIAAVLAVAASLPAAAAAQPATPAAVVTAAYTCVFAKTCAKSRARSYLTPSFARQFASVDALEKTCRCEVIDASPWIDAQAGPSTFSVGKATVHGAEATVPIHFRGGKSGAYSLTIRTQRAGSGWAISDIVMRDGGSTSSLMARNVAATRKYQRRRR